MLRLLAKVDRIRTKDTYLEGGLRRSRVFCYVTIRSTARSTFKMPKGLKGKSVRVTRTYVHPWKIEPGDLLVLDPQESEAAIREHMQLKPCPADALRLGEKKVLKAVSGSDGLRKHIVENVFLRSVISSDYGARVSELYNMGTGKNELYGGGGYGSGGYVLLGGVEESLSRVGKPPDLWNAPFKEAKTSGQDIAFEHKSEKKPGLQQIKSFVLAPDVPLLCQLSTFMFSPRKGKKKGKKEKLELNYVLRVFFGIGGRAGHTNLFFVPTEEELVRIRYNVPPWEFRWGGGIWDWRKKWHAVRPGFVLLADEDTSECLALFANPRELSFAWLGYNLGTPRVYLSHLPRKLKPKDRVRYGLGISAGIAFDVTRESLLLISRGRRREDGVPYSILYRGSSRKPVLEAFVCTDGSSSSVQLQRKSYEKFGGIFSASFEVEQEPENMSVDLTVGKEKLRAEVKR